MSEPLTLSVVEVRQYMRNVRTRMPFRYGAATLTAVPVLHLRTTVEAADGRRVEGWSADCLPPGWFDKRPGRVFRDDIASLRGVADAAVDAALEAAPGSAFAIWREVDARARAYGEAHDETALTASFGPALVERSVIDAVGKLAGTPFHETARLGLLGIDLGALHDELAGRELAEFLPAQPLTRLHARHTVGLADPLTDADLAEDERLHDGLPQTLEEYLVRRGVSYLKVKVSGANEESIDRVRTIAALLDRHHPGPYLITLDGNEQFMTCDEVAALLDRLAGERGLEDLYANIEYVEQPLARARALDPQALAGLPALNRRKPVVIDESDGTLDAFKTAVALGYQGGSVKNCKGVTKALANGCLAQALTAQRQPERPYFLTAEDLMNTAVVPLQQDLCTVASLHIPHVERNGHHYVRASNHLSRAEVRACLSKHETLYEPYRLDGCQVRIHHGVIDVESLQVPGYGVAFAPDWDHLTPAEAWRYEDLGLPE